MTIIRTEPTPAQMAEEALKQLAALKSTRFVIVAALPDDDGCDLIPCNVTPPEALWLLENAKAALLDGYFAADAE
jgi:hypothetical protein